MKYLGIDYGTKKVGVALSDDGASFAFPENIVPTESFFEYLKTITREQVVEAVVIGESLASNGERNDLSEKIHSLGKNIEEEIGLPVFFIREDFSSVEAHRYQTKKGSRDDSAAAIILQRFLDKKKK